MSAANDFLSWELFAGIGDELPELVRTLELLGEIDAAEAEWRRARAGLVDARRRGNGIAAARRRVDTASVELVRLRLMRARVRSA